MGDYELIFVVIGAWPILGFIGEEWALFWFLFSKHLRGDRRTERLQLYHDRLIVESVDAKGRFAAASLQPYWLQVVLKPTSRARSIETDNALYLRSHGKELEIGAFLSPAERREFAGELDRVIGRLKAGDYVPQPA